MTSLLTLSQQELSSLEVKLAGVDQTKIIQDSSSPQGVNKVYSLKSSGTRITKNMVAMLVSLTKDDLNSFVKEHQHGGYDVKCGRFIEKVTRFGYKQFGLLFCQQAEGTKSWSSTSVVMANYDRR